MTTVHEAAVANGLNPADGSPWVGPDGVTYPSKQAFYASRTVEHRRTPHPTTLDRTEMTTATIYTTLSDFIGQEISPALDGVTEGFDVDGFVAALRDAGRIIFDEAIQEDGTIRLDWQGFRWSDEAIADQEDGVDDVFGTLVERFDGEAITRTTLEALNAYERRADHDNVWQDVIYGAMDVNGP